MNRSIEDRVTAALDARAELVRPEDLGPMVVPDRPRRPRPAVVILLVAAAAAVVVALPFVLGGGDGSSPDPAPEPTPSVTEPDANRADRAARCRPSRRPGPLTWCSSTGSRRTSTATAGPTT